ncbi:MAG: hypothetical protein ACRENF_03510, partial [Thermodesulfobacteriota bacterium]
MGSNIKIYVASPLGFSEAGNEFYYGKLIPIIEQLGYDVLDPWKLTGEEKIKKVRSMPYGLKRRNAWRKINMEIAENNSKGID